MVFQNARRIVAGLGLEGTVHLDGATTMPVEADIPVEEVLRAAAR